MPKYLFNTLLKIGELLKTRAIEGFVDFFFVLFSKMTGIVTKVKSIYWQFSNCLKQKHFLSISSGRLKLGSMV